MKKKVCVFASSSNLIDEVYFSDATELGKLIGDANYDLVYGAGSVGTMYSVAVNAQNNGAKVFGIIPKKLVGIGVDWQGCDEFIITECMATRKKKMRLLSNAFIAIAGGFGTLEEILEVITLKQLGYHSKPIVFLNTNNFYTDLLAQFNKFYVQNFARKSNENLYFIANTPKEAIDYIQKYEITEPVSKW